MKALGVLFFLFSIGCTPKQTLQQSRWSGEGAKPSLPSQGLKTGDRILSANEKIEISTQEVDGFPVENSFAKVILAENEVRFQSWALIPKVSSEVLKSAKELDSQTAIAWLSFLSKYPEFDILKVESNPRVIIATQPKVKAVVSATLINAKSEIFQVQFLEDGSLFKKKKVGSGLNDLSEISVLTFPKGPKKSELTKVQVKKMNRPEGLSNSQTEVKSESPLKISGLQNFEFPPTDDRFDQVQAYYFANQFLSWIKAKIFLESPLKVTILTQVGYPEKTNTAFYYQGLIRLGAGDDESFAKIAWDPSIVMHEVAHAVIDQVSQLPFDGEGGSINEGFADTLTTYHLDSPYLADNAFKLADFRRNVESKVRLSEKTGGLYHDSAIVSSLFWELKRQIGKEKSLQLAIKVLNRMTPNSDFKDFALTMTEQGKEVFKDEEQKKVLPIMKEWEIL